MMLPMMMTTMPPKLRNTETPMEDCARDCHARTDRRHGQQIDMRTGRQRRAAGGAEAHRVAGQLVGAAAELTSAAIPCPVTSEACSLSPRCGPAAGRT